MIRKLRSAVTYLCFRDVQVAIQEICKQRSCNNSEEVRQGQMIGSMGRTGNFEMESITHFHIQAQLISTSGSSTLINIKDVIATKFSISPNGDVNTVNTILCEN